MTTIITTATTAPDRAEINRRNAPTSTGPRTPEGQDRSQFKAVKHGRTARTRVLPGEDAQALEGRLDGWKADLQSRNDVEDYLVAQAVRASWQLDRADRVQTVRLAEIIRTVPEQAVRQHEAEAAELGQRLFQDIRGPLALYPYSDRRFFRGDARISGSGSADDPDQPARLLHQLEATAAGCRWLLDRWAELRSLLDQGLTWQPPDKLKAIRLLGQQPLDAADSEEVARVFQASHVLDPQQQRDELDRLRALAESRQGDIQAITSQLRWHKGAAAFVALACELTDHESRAFMRRLAGRRVDQLRPRDATEARTQLRALVGRVTARLERLLRTHEERAAADAATAADRLAFDDTTAGERLRQYQLATGRSLIRTLNTLLKLRRTDAAPGCQRPGADCGAKRKGIPQSSTGIGQPENDSAAGRGLPAAQSWASYELSLWDTEISVFPPPRTTDLPTPTRQQPIVAPSPVADNDRARPAEPAAGLLRTNSGASPRAIRASTARSARIRSASLGNLPSGTPSGCERVGATEPPGFPPGRNSAGPLGRGHRAGPAAAASPAAGAQPRVKPGVPGTPPSSGGRKGRGK